MIMAGESGTESKLLVYYNIFGNDKMEATKTLKDAKYNINGVFNVSVNMNRK